MRESEAVPAQYRRWLVVSTAILLLSLLLLLGQVISAFVYFAAASTPVWVTVLGVLALFGMSTGFAGLFLLLAIAGARAWRGGKSRVITHE